MAAAGVTPAADAAAAAGPAADAAAAAAPAPDGLTRAGAIAIAVARVGIGVGTLALTRPALTALGFGDPAPATVVLARMAGARDLALGLQALAVRDDAARLRQASLLAAAVDVGDSFAFGAALSRRDGIDAAALKGLPIAAAAVVAGAWVSVRLGRRG